MKKCRSCGKWLIFPKKVRENGKDPVYMCFGCFLIETIGGLVNTIGDLSDFLQDVDNEDLNQDDGDAIDDVDAIDAIDANLIKKIKKDDDWDLRKNDKRTRD